MKTAWYKRWWFIVLVIFIVFIIITSLIGNKEESTKETTTPGQTEQVKKISLFEGEPSSILPTREEIATEWTLEGLEEAKLEVAGFVSGSALNILRMETLSASTGQLVAYKFESVDDTNNYYTDEVYKTKQEGGYTEISCSGIPADCFCIKGGTLTLGYYNWAICKKKNIVFMSEIGSFNIVRTYYYNDLAKVMGGKI